MREIRAASLCGLGLLVALATVQAADGPPAASRPEPKPAPAQIQPKLTYIPPVRGAPITRIGGASRGRTAEALVLSVLAPQHTGLTSDPKPVLYWYVSKAVHEPVEFTLNDPKADTPVLEMRLKGPFGPGIHSLRLADYPLQPGIEYQWFITLVPAAEQRARDIIAGGTIRRAQPPPLLARRLPGADPRQLPPLYAEQGFWYDAIAVLSQLIDSNPGDKSLREQRAELLEQVGLTAAAAYDRDAAGPHAN
ncbi:MAG: DUF928 domain-containing protein [Candidatus Competibacteraceae bacterium]